MKDNVKLNFEKCKGCKAPIYQYPKLQHPSGEIQIPFAVCCECINKWGVK